MFITKWDRHHYLHEPQGLNVAGNAHARHFEDIKVDVPCMSKCADDTILWDSNIEALWHAVVYIELCTKNGIIFNPKTIPLLP